MNRFYPSYPPSKPRAVQGGIVARSKRGAIAQHHLLQQYAADRRADAEALLDDGVGRPAL